MNTVNNRLTPYGLYIDELMIKEVNEYVPFLDIQFCFDFEGKLQTDLYVKTTDARSYLNFHSEHPKHVFPGIVYSQCLRLRRKINDNDRLKLRLSELLSADKEWLRKFHLTRRISDITRNSGRPDYRRPKTDDSR